MKSEVKKKIEIEVEDVDEAKREFMKKFGKYAATAPVGMYLLMGAGASRAQASTTISCRTRGSTVSATLKDDQNIYVDIDHNNHHKEITLSPGDRLYAWLIGFFG